MNTRAIARSSFRMGGNEGSAARFVRFNVKFNF